MYLLVIFLGIICYSSAANVTHTLHLNSGHNCPIVGLGTGGYATGGPPQDKVVMQMVRDAIDIGYRHIDTASHYFNEKAIGQALNQLISEGKVKREDIFLTTKVFPDRLNTSEAKEEALNSIHLSLQKLNLTFVDLMLIHRPSDNQFNTQYWKGLEDAVDKGLVKSIGVSNFNVTQLESLVKSAKVVPAMNQIESHPKLNQRQLIEFCAKHDIHLTAYSPLGAGKLFTDPTITAIGKKHNKTSAQVMIRWQIQRGIVAIPKSTRKDRLTENFNVFDFSLTNDEMKVLEDMK